MSVSRCVAITKSGTQCKCRPITSSDKCSAHSDFGDCSICLDTITCRGSRRIKCGHIFHIACLDTWKARGKNTCPTCRQYFDCSKFQVALSIFNTEAQATSTMNLASNVVNQIIAGMDNDVYIDFESTQTDITFDIDTVSALSTLLEDFGASLSNVDTSLLDTV